MDWLDIVTSSITLVVALGFMLGKWRQSGEKFDIDKFGTSLITVLAAVGLVIGTTRGANVQVTGDGLVGVIIQAVLSGIGAVAGISFASKVHETKKG